MAEKRKDKKGRILKDGEDQRKDGCYRYRYIDASGKRCEVYSWKLVDTDILPKGKRECESLRTKIKQINRDMQDGVKSSLNSKITLNDMFEKYIASKYELKQSTRTNYKYMYNNYIRNTIGNRKITSFRYSDIKSFYNSLIQVKGFKPNSMEIIHTILHPIFTLAVRDGYIRSNPAAGVMSEIKKSSNWEKPKRHALTIEEQQAFIDYTAQSEIYNHWLPLFTFFLGTGCRMGEIIGLRWCDCDFDNRTININHNLVYRQQDSGKCEMHITTPKTNAGCRMIPMLDEVKDALLQERKQQMINGFCKAEIDGYSGFIFSNRNGYVHNPETINRAIKRIYKAYNFEEIERAKAENREPIIIRPFTAHNLRHTFCTRFCENETNIKVIQEIMGHSDIGTTMNIYAEATESKKRESFKNLQGKIKIC